MTIINSQEERFLRRIPWEILILSSIIALASLFLFKSLTALFILAGGVLSALSFIWLKQTISRLLLLNNGDSPSWEMGQPPFLKKALRSVLTLYGLRLVLILGIFFIIIFFFSKKIIAFVAGFSTMIPVFLVEAIIALSKMKKWKT